MTPPEDPLEDPPDDLPEDLAGAADPEAGGRDRAPPQRGGSVAEQAYLSLRDDILAGRLAAGERLTEVTLAEALGISRTPVREAVKRLILEGFLIREPGQGLQVVTLTADEVEQIFEIRLRLESYAARRAARHATPAEIATLKTLADAMSAHTPPGCGADYDAISEANAAFHRQVMLAARSPRLGAMLSLAVNLGLVLRTYRMYSARDLTRSSQHHHELVEAIAARAPDWAASVMAAHLQAAARVAIRPDSLAETPPDPPG